MSEKTVSLKNAIRLYLAGYRASDFAYHWRCGIDGEDTRGEILEYHTSMILSESNSEVAARCVLGLANFNHAIVNLPAPTLNELLPMAEEECIQMAISFRLAHPSSGVNP